MAKDTTVLQGRSEFASRVDLYEAKLNASQKKIAAYLLAHEAECLELSIYEIAENIGLSVATVTRFCQALGYAGLAEMKFHIRQQEVAFTPNDMGIHKTDDMNAIKQKSSQFSENAMRGCVLGLDNAVLDRAVDAIAHAKTVMMTAIGSAGGICKALSGLYVSAGIYAVQYDDALYELRMASMLKKGDVVIAISHDGQAKTTGDVMMVAKDKEAQTILVTSATESLLAGYADMLLQTPARTRGNALNIAASQLCQMQVLQILLIGVITKYHDRFAKIGAEQMRLNEMNRYAPQVKAISRGSVIPK